MRGYYFISKDSEVPPNNGAVHTAAKIIKAGMSSAAEAELGGLYILMPGYRCPREKTLEELKHKQPRTPMQTDNSTAMGVVSNKIQPKQTKAMDMIFHWLSCRDLQGQFRYYWLHGEKMGGLLDQAPQCTISPGHEARISDGCSGGAGFEGILEESKHQQHNPSWCNTHSRATKASIGAGTY